MPTRFIRTDSSVADSFTGNAAAIGVNSSNELQFNSNGTKQSVPGSVGLVPVAVTGATVTLDPATHGMRTVLLDRAAGIAVTLPAATGTGAIYRLVVKTTFTGDCTIKVASALDYMIGTALLFADGGDTTVGFATANTGTVATETDTLDIFDASNVTGGFKGAIVELQDIASAIWSVRYVSDAAGTEATPFKVTV